MWKWLFGVAIRIIVAALLVGAALLYVDKEAFSRLLQSLDLFWFFVITVGILVTQLISGLRWWLILKETKLRVSYVAVVQALFWGMYVNSFGLGTIGGDVVKGTMIGRLGGDIQTGLISAFVDRAVGAGSLLFVGIAASLVFGNPKFSHQFLLIAAALFGAVVITGLLVIGSSRYRSLPPYLRRLATRFGSITDWWFSSGLCISNVACLFHILQAVVVWQISQGIGANVPLVTMLAIVPFVQFLSLIPISWNGVGVREQGYLYFMVPALMTAEQAILTGLIWLSSMLVISMISGGVGALLSIGPLRGGLERW